jgi:hypothetical protein
MMRRQASVRRDRVLAAIEIPALGIWLGALLGFAFVSAPLAFRLIAPLDLARFAALTAASVGQLTIWGYVLGGIALLAAVARAVDAADRRWDLARIVLLAVALGLIAWERQSVVPAMQATTDLRSPQYRALHMRSSEIYGGAALCALIALVLAAARAPEE